MKANIRLTISIATALTLLLTTSMVSISDKENQNKQYHYWEDPATCSGCHFDRFDRYSVSQHSKAFTGDFFQAQFYDVVLPSQDFDDVLANAGDDCIGCHSPSAFLSGDMVPDRRIAADNHWNPSEETRTQADRGVFCDFCHTLDRFKNPQPFNHDYISHATEEIDPKRADLEFPWSPHHEIQSSEIYEDIMICASCHNELNPYGTWVKETEHEYSNSVYPSRGIVCQTCHMQPMAGKPAKMGFIRPHNTDHWFGGGFADFVEGAAGVYFQQTFDAYKRGGEVDFSILVKTLATGHNFPTGSVEERDVWMHVSLQNNKGEELMHIPIPANPNDPNDSYFITSNEKVAYASHSKLSEAIARDGLTEGDRIYHSVFLDSEGKVTYAQWMTVQEISNRLEPLEERLENYTFSIPNDLDPGEYLLTAVMNYRRMPDPLADYLKVERRPIVEVARDVRKIVIQ